MLGRFTGLAAALALPAVLLSQGGPLRVSPEIQAWKLIEYVEPVYPRIAKQMRIQGTVRIEVQIGRDGCVLAGRAIGGHPLLVPASLEAVRQWCYRPTLVSDAPAEVVTIVEITYTLGLRPYSPHPARRKEPVIHVRQAADQPRRDQRPVCDAA